MDPASTAPVESYVRSKKLRSTKTLEVWRARVEQSGRPCLVKRLRPELAEKPRLVEQFVIRARRAKRLNHRGLERITDVVVGADEYYLVAESYDGQTVHEIIDRLRAGDNALPAWFALHVTYKVGLALAHAHGDHHAATEAVYHQGVSTDNVVITDLGEVLLVDFGLSHSALFGVDGAATAPTSNSGEFAVGGPHFGDAQSDIKGLGGVFYELLTGHHVSKRYVSPSRHVAWGSPEIDQLVGRMLSVPGAAPYPNIHHVTRALDEIVQRQRQPVDNSHLAGLLHLVTTSFPSPKVRQPKADALPRAKTMLPEPIIDIEADRSRSTPPQHDWDAAVTRTRAESQRPPPLPETEAPISATESFERGLEKLKAGDLGAAESEWLHALAIDPNHRLSQVNLKLLRRLRSSKRPAALK